MPLNMDEFKKISQLSGSQAAEALTLVLKKRVISFVVVFLAS